MGVGMEMEMESMAGCGDFLRDGELVVGRHIGA